MEIIGILIAVCIVISIVQTIFNLSSPVITREAQIVRKYSSEDSGDRTYYVVFEFSNGQRQKFKVNFWQYHGLSRGATGILHSQGSWYQGFDQQ
jgi:Protein of unknown function (DUF2500)